MMVEVTLAAIYSIMVGLAMITQWTLTLVKRQVPGREAGGTAGRGQVEMAFHWVAEFGTAVCLIAAGAGLLMEAGWGRTLYWLSTGMLLYTVVNSPGYFAQNRQWPMVGMFAVLLVMTLVVLGVHS
jgi:hypothetical protein